MPDIVEESIQAAELAIFQRKSLSLAAAATKGLQGRFKSFSQGGLRASMATADHYGFLNIAEGLDDQSVMALPDVLKQFQGQHQPTLIATTPSPGLIDRLLRDGYTPAPARPIAYLHPSTNNRLNGIVTDEWDIHEVATKTDATLFLALLDAGYATSREIEIGRASCRERVF